MALAALRISLARGSRPGWKLSPGGAFAAILAEAFGVGCVVCALPPLAARSTPTATTVMRHNNVLVVIASSMSLGLRSWPLRHYRRRSGNHAAFKHLVCDRRRYPVNEHGADLRIST